MQQYKSRKISLQKMYKEKKETERIRVERYHLWIRKISPLVDLARRLDCFYWISTSIRSKEWSQCLSIRGGGSPQNTEFNGLIHVCVYVGMPRYLSWKEGISHCLLQHCGSVVVRAAPVLLGSYLGHGSKAPGASAKRHRLSLTMSTSVSQSWACTDWERSSGFRSWQHWGRKHWEILWVAPTWEFLLFIPVCQWGPWAAFSLIELL